LDSFGSEILRRDVPVARDNGRLPDNGERADRRAPKFTWHAAAFESSTSGGNLLYSSFQQRSSMLYDDQAAHYDERVGVPGEAAAAVAAAVDTIVGLAPGTRVLEPGVGTGLVSMHLLRYPIEYIGFDRSPAMLEVVRAKVETEGLSAQLLVADGNDPWPAADRSIDLVFCARALHHIDAEHVVAELDRVVREERGWLVVGRVRRPPDSVKAQMRRQMRRLLREAGFDARSHDHHSEAIFSQLEARGAAQHETVVAARWRSTHRPADSIASWREKEGLGAQNVPADVKEGVLDGVRQWALEHFGDLDRTMEQEEFFELSPISIRKI
jgi:ubiquinone/menaquinone biosynthesis C-methylase UbiE